MAGWPRGRALDGGIDEIPLPDGVTRGRLWLCGKHAVGPDPEAALARVGATTIVCLTERRELADRYPGYVDWIDAQHGERAIRFPIADLHAPPPVAMETLLEQLRGRLDAGEGLIVHCGAGIGRAGTVAVCLLMSLGVRREEALETVALHRPMSGPEVGAQRELVDELARRSAG
jgi:protein-tyrosine phosphatase